MVQQPLVRQCLLIIEASRSQTHHTRYYPSARVIGPKQRLLLDNTQHSQKTDIYVPNGIRTRNPSNREAANPRLRPRVPLVSAYRYFIYLYFLTVMILRKVIVTRDRCMKR